MSETPAVHFTDRAERRVWLALAGVAFLVAILAAYACCRWQIAPYIRVRPLAMQGAWIAPPGDSEFVARFRKSFAVSGTVKNAWMAVAARDAFEVCVNGNPAGHLYLWRPSRPYQTGLSERGQALSVAPQLLSLNYPREYQWASHDNALLPVFLDLTPYFKAGPNVVTVEVTARHERASVRFDGAVELHNGEVISLNSDGKWKANTRPENTAYLDWTKLNYRDDSWADAAVLEGESAPHYTTFDPRLFTTAFDPKWIRHPAAGSGDAVWFETTCTVSAKPDDAWLRVAVNRAYDLFINDVRVRPAQARMPDLDFGDWIVGSKRTQDEAAMPELLDPDEAESVFSGKRFERPRNRESSGDDAEALLEASGRADQASLRQPWQPDRWVDRFAGRSLDMRVADYGAPGAVTPPSVSKDRETGVFNMYSVVPLMRRGVNKIAVRLTAPDSADSLNWPAQLAMDGEVRVDRAETVRVATGSGNWTAGLDRGGERCTEMVAASPVRTVEPLNGRFPARYFSQLRFSSIYTRNSWLALAGAVILFVLGIIGATAARCVRRARGDGASGVEPLARMIHVLLLPAGVLVTAVLLETALAEQHEYVRFLLPDMWRGVLVTAVLATLAGWLLLTFPSRDARGTDVDAEDAAGSVRGWVHRAPRSIEWKIVLYLVLLLGFALRTYKLDYQPLDDDAYASAQAVLAIADTGLPIYQPEVWYTRSPFYHYLTAGFVLVFGRSPWALQMPSALFSVATGWVLYLMGTRLLRSPWVGMAALVLCMIHPYEVFTGHVARFYQQQQFFLLLTIYFFCRGFVGRQYESARYWTLFAFLAAVLSQEISIIVGLQLALGYVFFAKDRPWRDTARLAVTAACCVGIIVLDVLVFKTRCMTRPAGVSYGLEATISPHFWSPYNFLALFIGYARLHLVLSIWLFVGMPFALRRCNPHARALYFMLFSGVALTNVLVTTVSLRYQYWLIPLWILLGVYGIQSVLQALRALVGSASLHALYGAARRRDGVSGVHCYALGVILFVGVVLSWSPWRIPGSYGEKLVGDSSSALRYVAGEMRTGDKVMVTAPHTHAATVELGRADYDLSIPILYDYMYMKDGRLVDRNGGAEAVDSLAKLRQVVEEQDRVWIVVNRERFRNQGKSIPWKYPAGRVGLFLQKNCEVKYESYSWTVYLWDKGAGRYRQFRADAG